MTRLRVVPGERGVFLAVLIPLPIPVAAVRVALKLCDRAKMSALLTERWNSLCICTPEFERAWLARVDERPGGFFLEVHAS